MTDTTRAAVTFGAVGDLTFGDHPLCVGIGAFSRFRTEDPLFPFRPTLEVLRQCDFLLGNLECSHSAIGLRRWNYRSVQMRGEPRMLAGLRTAGFTVVNVANNHSMQHGDEAFRDTVAMVENSGIACCGVALPGSAAKRARPTIVRRNGLRIGVLGYSMRPRQYFEHTPLYAEGRPDEMLRDITTLRQTADAVVVSVHWGEEFVDEPSPSEVHLARQMVDAGAAIVIGHHPHALRCIECYGGGCIAYSLGNFVCDMSWDESLRISAVFRCELDASGARNAVLVPVRINDDYQPELLAAEPATAALRRLERLGAGLPKPGAVPHPGWEAQYARSAESCLRDIRAKSQAYFVANMRRYPMAILAQQLAGYAVNRLKERLPSGSGRPP